jgi:hypothetical protein
MKVSPEEFFMYLTIGLIVLVPIGARIYRYVTMRRVKQTLHEQFRPRDEVDKPTGAQKRS